MTVKQTLRVELEDGSEHTVTVDGRDFRAWEAWRGVSMFKSDTTLMQLTEYAYLSGRRQGLWNGKYEDWEPTCVGVDFVAIDEVNPTQSAPMDDFSSLSPSEPASASESGKKRGKKPS